MSAADFIPYGRQSIEEDDIRAVVEVLRSPYLTTGPKVSEFESAMARYVSAPHAVAFSSGTAALHGAYAAAGLGPGDEILVPTLSFLATANAALYVGAKPVFVDALADGLNLDVDDARRKITPHTKAIVPVHFAGQPADMDAVARLAKEFNLIVIEDAAHALGAEWRGKKIGSLSDMTVLSFHPVKHITTGEGGMVLALAEKHASFLRRFRHHGIDVDVTRRDSRQQWSYDMVELGYNYRLTDIQSALGLSQLHKLERFLSRRREIAQTYTSAFQNADFLRTPPVPSQGSDKHAWHLYIIRLVTSRLHASRDEIFRRLRALGIGVHVHYRPIHLHPYYASLGWKKGDCPRAEQAFEGMLSLPIFPAMTDDMVKRVIFEIRNLMPITAATGQTVTKGE